MMTNHKAGFVLEHQDQAAELYWLSGFSTFVVLRILRSAGRRSNISGVFAGGVGRVTGRSQQVRGPEAR
jgi:hypothetical protein